VSAPEVVRRGVLDVLVCVPVEFTDDQVLAFANTRTPSGTTDGWQIRRQGNPQLNGRGERMKCAVNRGHVHMVLDALEPSP